jgi:hypothetical protein
MIGSLVRFSLTGCLALSAALSLTSTVSAENWAEKMFSETKHDFRVVGRGTKAEYKFEFRNLYEETVHVQGVRSSCGCTTPTVSDDTLETHETSSIVAKLNTSTFIGQKAATVTVVFDRPYYAEVQLQVSGFIRTDVTFDPPEVDFGQCKNGEVKEQDITITHRGNTNWRLTDVRSHCDDFAVKLETPIVQPNLVQYKMRVRMKETMSEGEIRERLTLVSNDTKFPTIEMSISGMVRPTISVSPAAVSLGTTESGQTVSKRLLVRGEEPFQIQEVVCSDDRFQFEIPEGKKKLHFLEMKFTGGDNPDRVAQRIQIVTDLPGDKSAECVATGTVR